jgi:hypothetical protein
VLIDVSLFAPFAKAVVSPSVRKYCVHAMGSCLKWVIILPIFNFFTALALFLTLLLLWVTTGHPRYKPNESSVVYISDVGK